MEEFYFIGITTGGQSYLKDYPDNSRLGLKKKMLLKSEICIRRPHIQFEEKQI
jgi:hypothetical protein